MNAHELYAQAEELAESAIDRNKDPLACFLLTENIVMLTTIKRTGAKIVKDKITGGVEIKPEILPEQPPIDNDYVFDGCMKFGA